MNQQELVDAIVAEIEQRIAAVEDDIAAESGPDGNLYMEARVRGERSGLRDAINIIKLIELRAFLARNESV